MVEVTLEEARWLVVHIMDHIPVFPFSVPPSCSKAHSAPQKVADYSSLPTCRMRLHLLSSLVSMPHGIVEAREQLLLEGHGRRPAAETAKRESWGSTPALRRRERAAAAAADRHCGCAPLHLWEKAAADAVAYFTRRPALLSLPLYMFSLSRTHSHIRVRLKHAAHQACARTHTALAGLHAHLGVLARADFTYTCTQKRKHPHTHAYTHTHTSEHMHSTAHRNT